VIRPLLAAAGFAALASCSTPQVVTATNNFDRASDVDFVCFDTNVTPPRALPAGECGINPQDNSATTPGRVLFALVTQAERGELAAVNLAASTGTALVDNTGNIPGYTFVPVGALPAAVVVDVRAGDVPSSVWVASAADRTVERLDAAAVLRDPRTSDPGRVTARLAMNGAPHDLALDTVDGRTLLYATVPDRGAIAVFDVTDPRRPVDRGFTPVTSPGGNGALDGGAADGGITAGHPAALAVDAETHRVYATDDRANVIHVLEGSPLREVARIDSGAPTRAVALTGWARRVSCAAEAADPDHFARARYLYATHATTGAVVVVDVTRGARVLPNRLPAPNAEGRPLDATLGPERVALAAPAVALVAINSLEYRGVDAMGQVLSPAVCRAVASGCRGSAAVDPTQLHGVFVAAVLRDGRIAVIDVDDYDAPARAGTAGVLDNANAYRFIRHAPRAAAKLTDPPRLSGQPIVSALVRGTQRTPVSDLATVPGIACGAARTAGASPGCAAPFFGVELAPRAPVPPAFVPPAGGPAGDPDAAVPEPACADAAVTVPANAAADPYAVRNETWGLTWDAVIPGLDISGGALVASGDQLSLEAPGANFCTRGAFVGQGVNDGVSIVGDITAAARDRETCTRVFGSAISLVNRDFVITEAAQDRLVLRPPAGVDAALVQRCFPQATRFEVRTRDSWIVVGSRTGYQTAVTADAQGRCVVDAAKQDAVRAFARACLLTQAPLAERAPQCLAGRACLGAVDPATGASAARTAPVFANAFFCLQVLPASERLGDAAWRAREVPRDEQISFSVTGAWEPLVLQGGTFPVAARFVPGVERLYVVDTQSSGLMEYRTTPLQRTRNFN
jgi:hypothetical protein